MLGEYIFFDNNLLLFFTGPSGTSDKAKPSFAQMAAAPTTLQTAAAPTTTTTAAAAGGSRPMPQAPPLSKKDKHNQAIDRDQMTASLHEFKKDLDSTWDEKLAKVKEEEKASSATSPAAAAAAAGTGILFFFFFLNNHQDKRKKKEKKKKRKKTQCILAYN